MLDRLRRDKDKDPAPAPIADRLAAATIRVRLFLVLKKDKDSKQHPSMVEPDRLAVVRRFTEAGTFDVVKLTPEDVKLLCEQVEIETSVRELHERSNGGVAPYCRHCRFKWPCPTTLLLDRGEVDAD